MYTCIHKTYKTYIYIYIYIYVYIYICNMLGDSLMFFVL